MIVGGIIVVSVVAYGVYKHRSNCRNEFENKSGQHPTPDNFAFDEVSKASATDVLGARETTVVSSLKERHSEAAKVMQESLNTIFFESEDETIVTDNTNVLEKMGSDLADLLE